MTWEVGMQVIEKRDGVYGTEYNAPTTIANIGSQYVRTADGRRYRHNGYLRGERGWHKAQLVPLAQEQQRFQAWCESNRRRGLREEIKRGIGAIGTVSELENVLRTVRIAIRRQTEAEGRLPKVVSE